MAKNKNPTPRARSQGISFVSYIDMTCILFEKLNLILQNDCIYSVKLGRGSRGGARGARPPYFGPNLDFFNVKLSLRRGQKKNWAMGRPPF